MLNLNLNIVGAGGRSNIGAGPDVGPTTTTTTTTTTSTTTTSTTTTAGPVSFRTDPYSASLQLALPGAYFPSLGMTAYNEDVSQLIRGTGTGYGVLPSISFGSGSFLAAVSAPIPKWTSNNYSSSMQVVSNGDCYIATATSSVDFNNLNSSSFTIETWVNQNDWNSAGGACEVYRAYSNGPLLFTLASEPTSTSRPQIETVLIRQSDSAEFVYIANPYLVSPNTWYHTAVVRDGNQYNMLLNGEVVMAFTNAATLKNDNNAYIMGKIGTPPYSSSFQDFRLYKGVAVYPYQASGSTYTPPLSMIL
jgi:hypothetical protein